MSLNEPAYRIAAVLNEALELLGMLTDDSRCRLDHHGYCQEHGWFGEGECPTARAQRLLGRD